MPEKYSSTEIIFYANKVYVHHWPLDSIPWDELTKNQVDLEFNKNPDIKKISIKDDKIKINELEFEEIKKVGVTIPLFKKETTLVFEGKFGDFFSHVHITTQSRDYLEIFNKIMTWKNGSFPNTN